MSLDLVAIMRHHATAVLTVDQAGALVEPLRRHPAGIAAPLKLIAFIERRESQDQLVAEIGIGRGHPYRSNHNIEYLPKRRYRNGLELRQVQGLSAKLYGLLESWAFERLKQRPWLPTQPKERYNYGLGIAVDDRDSHLQRLFDELEQLNPLLDHRLRHLAYRIGQYRLRPMKGGYPKSWRDNLVAEWFFNPLCARGYLRPLVLSRLAQFLQANRNGKAFPRGRAFIEYLEHSGVIAPETAALASSYFSERLRGTYRLGAVARVLPRSCIHWHVLYGYDGLPVTCERRVGDTWVYMVHLRNPLWQELPGVKLPDLARLKEKLAKEQRIKKVRLQAENEEVRSPLCVVDPNGYPADWDTIPPD